MSMGYIRVFNSRIDMDPEGQPEENETVVVVDRTSPIYGNPHVLKNKTDSKEREVVLQRFKQDIEADFERKGPIYQECFDMAKRLNSGENFALQCKCRPYPCHGDIIAEKTYSLAKDLQ